jgi:DNA-binding transcriptional ArsR family regulator
MRTMTGRLRDYAEAISDPSRGAIVVELDRAGELTATQLARRLGLTPNNVYHHMRVLLQLGVVDPPRPVPGDTYVEKYYHINPEIRSALRLDPSWYEGTQEAMTVEDRQSSLVSLCLTMAHLLRRAAREYQEMDAGELDRAVREQKLLMLSISRISREELQGRLATIRQALYDGDPKWAEDTGSRTDLLLLAGLPRLWDGAEDLDAS